MAGTLKLTDIAHSSGAGTITVDSLATLAISTGKLTVGGTAIETGAQGVISKTATYPIVAGDFTGKSSLIVFVDVSAGTSTAADITLPAAADFGTCAIHVVSTATHGSGNSIVIKLGAAEQYTLYGKGDHCELVSDGTNVFRTGNEYVTLRGYVCATANLAVAANSSVDVWDGMTYTEEEDLGGNWSTVTDDFTAPFDGEYMFQGDCKYGSWFIGYNLKKNGTYLAGTHTQDHGGGDANVNNYPVQLVAGDVIQYWMTNTYGAADTLYGNASASASRMRSDWWCVRRY
jgi:hypothetical protein